MNSALRSLRRDSNNSRMLIKSPESESPWTMRLRRKLAHSLFGRRRAGVAGALAALAFLAAVLCALFHESIFLDKCVSSASGILSFAPWKQHATAPPSNPLLADQFLRTIPVKHWLHTNLGHWKLPLWNPFICCGAPALAAMQTAALFPIDLAFSFLDPFRAGTASVFAKLLCAGFFTFIFVRQLGVSGFGALFSGTVFGLCGFMIVWLGHPHVNCALWLPLLLYLVEREFRSRESGRTPRHPLRTMAAFSVAFGFMLLGGHPPTAIHVTMATLAYFLFRFYTSQSPLRRNSVFAHMRFITFGILVGVLIAAPQILPFLEYHNLSSSALASQNLNRTASHLGLNTLTHLLLPHISGNPVAGHQDLGILLHVAAADNFNERTAFVGVLTLFLALVAAIYVRGRTVLFFFALILICAYVIFGGWPAMTILGHLPILNAVNHTRLILLICFSLAVLAGFGLDGLQAAKEKRSFGVLVLGLFVAACWLVGWLLQRLQPALDINDPDLNRFVYRQIAIFASGIVAVILLALWPRRFAPRSGKCLALCCVTVELVWFGMGYNPSISRADYYPSADAIEFLKKDRSLFRITGIDRVLPPNTGQMYGLYDVRGRDYMAVRRYEELVTGKAGDFWFYSANTGIPQSITLSNTRYVMTHPNRALPAPAFTRVYHDDVAIYRVDRYLDRAFLVYDYEVMPDKASALKKITAADFDPLELLVLEQEPALLDVSVAALHSAPEPDVSVVRYEADDVVLEVSSPRPGFVVLLDTCFPGWKAFVDGDETPIYRADYNFRAVTVPAGRSSVHFTYRPLSFRIGLALALVSMGLLALAALFRQKVQPNQNASQPA